MYETLSGRLARVSPAEAVVEIGGIGYLLKIPLSTYEAIQRQTDVTLICHYQVRDDGAYLFGFATEIERALFRLLLSVSRIGPGVAITILSATRPAVLVAAIRDGDAARLEAVKGIGKKTAQRLVLELKEPIERVASLVASEPGAAPLSPLEDDATLALTALGYSPADARTAIEKARKTAPAATVEALIKQALQGS